MSCACIDIWRCGGKKRRTKERTEERERRNKQNRDPKKKEREEEEKKRKIRNSRTSRKKKDKTEGVPVSEARGRAAERMDRNRGKNVRQGRVEDPGDHGRVRSIPCPAWSVAGRIATCL